MSIAATCPSCAQQVNAPNNAAGKQAKCPRCQQLITIPGGANGPGAIAPVHMAPAPLPAPTPEPIPAPASSQPPQGPHGLWHLVPALLLAVVALLALNLVLTLVTTFRGTPTASAAWEYKTMGILDTEFDSKMDELGRQGWEVAVARRAMSGGVLPLYEVIFKRRR